MPVQSQSDPWQQLNDQLLTLYAARKFEQALPVARRAVQAARLRYGAQDRRFATALSNLALVYEALAQLKPAEESYKQSLRVLSRLNAKDDPDIALVDDSLAGFYREAGQYAAAAGLLEQALQIRSNHYGPDSLEVAETLAHQGLLFSAQGDLAGAERVQRRALQIRQGAGEHALLDVAVTLNDLASTLEEQGRYSEAEVYLTRALRIRRDGRAEETDIAVTEDNLGVVYTDEGRYLEAESLHKDSLAIRERVFGANAPEVAYSLNNLAQVYADEGRYAEAEPLYTRALKIRMQRPGPGSDLVAETLDNLATLYVYQDRFAEAEPLYQRAAEINESLYGPDKLPIATNLNNLALMYQAEGQYAAAETLLKRVLAIREARLGPSSLQTADTLTNLGVLYEEQSRYPEAITLDQRALKIYQTRLPPNHPRIAKIMSNLGILYEDEGKRAAAEEALRRSLAMTEATQGPDHPDLGTTLNDLGVLYKHETRYPEAIAVYKRALTIAEKSQSRDGSAVGTTLTNLAMCYYAAGQPASAVDYFEQALSNRRAQFENQFSHMNERERLTFVKGASELLPIFLSFSLKYQDQFPQLRDEVYDLLLWSKGLVVGSLASDRAYLSHDSDPQTLALFDQLTAVNRELVIASRAATPASKSQQDRLSQLTQKADTIQKALAARSGRFSTAKRLAAATWRDIQQALGPEDAAVEYVKFRFHDQHQWTSHTNYAAVVVTRASEHPELVLLPDTAVELEGPVLDDYRDSVARPGDAAPHAVPGRSFGAHFWDPIVASLGGATRVYVSTDGVLDTVAFGLVTAADGHLLMNEHSLRLLLSTKDILRPTPSQVAPEAALFGNPTFALNPDEYRASVLGMERSSALAVDDESHMPSSPTPHPSVTSLQSGVMRGVGPCPNRPAHGILCPLPETEAEVDTIAQQLTSHNWVLVGPFTQQRALKEAILGLRHPRLLHIATHGFWSKPVAARGRESSPPLAADSMLRSGLFLAGADQALRTEHSGHPVANGILTAYEISTMDLQGTELVVLSACDTGLGTVEAGEGVFGLRRGLQEAGAQAILMSLWPVPETETKEVMQLFYEKWLSGEDKHDALRDAELEERTVVARRWGLDRPDLWGAFVVVGR